MSVRADACAYFRVETKGGAEDADTQSLYRYVGSFEHDRKFHFGADDSSSLLAFPTALTNQLA